MHMKKQNIPAESQAHGDMALAERSGGTTCMCVAEGSVTS